ncbi:DUF317 domain-containing protein [Streptomyces sp. NPDC088745]|uniref:DUF317 domain-containing protein n=1 Tax=Streptomyces sp. NPDC088745 TaxID=3365884 RepID=UPI003806BAA1
MTPTTPAPAHVLLGPHPGTSAVLATLHGDDTRLAQALLHQQGFTPASAQIMILARIDREEAHYTKNAITALREDGIIVTVAKALHEELHTEWSWADHPMHWLTDEEKRGVSADAQQIHDDIRDGRLIIHAHAHDGHTTVAVGTYRDGTTVNLHGENHLWVVATTSPTAREALTQFVGQYHDKVRLGAAPPTHVETEAAQALTEAALLTPQEAPTPPYAAGPGDHDAVLETFLDTHSDWTRWQTWSDNTTHLVHDEQTLRIEREHETTRGDTAWTIAAYESPVSDRLWHLSLTTDTPEPVLRTVLDTLADNDLTSRPVSEESVHAITSPLFQAGWKHSADEYHQAWEITGATGLQLNRTATWHIEDDTWTLWGGPSIHHPTWTLTASRAVPVEILTALAEELTTETPPPPTRARARNQQDFLAAPPHLPTANRAKPHPQR